MAVLFRLAASIDLPHVVLEVHRGHELAILLAGARLGHVRLSARRVADARHRGDRVVELRRQEVRVALADQEDRLAPLADRSHVDRQAGQRREAHLVADPLDRGRRVERVALLELVARPVVVLAPLESLDGAHGRLVVAREQQVADRRQRIHERHHVVGRQLLGDEVGQVRSGGHRAAPAHVVVVEEDRDEPHVVARRLQLLVALGSDGTDRLAGGRGRLHLDVLERLDRLRLAVLGHFEVGLGEVADGIALPVRHDDVHADEVDAGSEGRPLRLLSLIDRGILRGGLRRHRLGRLRCRSERRRARRPPVAGAERRRDQGE